ncbi:amino acid aminotransferase [Azovibrio restrictus]|uniref:amino acid aminotransferase n=1 Tax=Azovibrio restrictus TaxID=146938 RepID=UPI0026ECAEDD|nr:amino acid aminotransferase [Azovibrio restrictus]MDD3481761.1 aspartate/tyrosine/aromatic aminotransferase [Azovibrio restrictus]
MFASFQRYPADPIFSVLPKFQQDRRLHKVNLSIGLYYDETGALPLLSSVKEALANLHAKPEPSSYLPMEGHAGYRQAVQRLLFGTACQLLASGRISTIQTLGGTGALRIGAEILKRRFPASSVWVSEPTWENQVAIFKSAGFEVHRYPYYNPASRSVDFESLVCCLKGLAPHSILILHACCHNPTGLDLSSEQWDEVTSIAAERELIPFFDCAYQGFGQGMQEDAYSVRVMASHGVSCLIASSFSKNFALYGERCGALTFVCPTPCQAELAHAEMAHTVRANYSNPPSHGANIIANILLDSGLAALWRSEVENMRLRLESMRTALVEALERNGQGHHFRHLLETKGMFGLTGLSAQQVETLRDEFAIYLVESGRLCFSGLNAKNVTRVADSLGRISTGPDVNCGA